MKLDMIYDVIKYSKLYGHKRFAQRNLSSTEYMLCTFLNFNVGVSQDDASTELHINKTTVAKALKNLEKRGLVRREPNVENRRKNKIFLTDSGKGIVDGAVEIYRDWEKQVTTALTKKEQQSFDELITKICDKAKILSEDK